MQHKKILTQGGMVHYWINRKENAADCIVFTHGVTADHTMFEQQVSYFYGNYTIILWDVPMHGLSRPYQGFSYHNTAEILRDILRQTQQLFQDRPRRHFYEDERGCHGKRTVKTGV